MALDLSGVSAQLARMFDLRIRSQINRTAPLLEWLPKKAYAGKAVDWRPTLGGRTAANFASGAPAPTATEDSRVSATLAWARAHTTIEIAFDALIIALASPNVEDALVDLFAEEAFLAGRVLGKKINAECFTGDGASNNAVGLATAVLDSGAYAGITDSDWVSAAHSTTGAQTLTNTHMNSFDEAIFNQYGRPLGPQDAYFTSPKLYKEYGEDVGQHPRRIVNEGSINLAGGWAALEHGGIPMFRDADCPAQNNFGLRRDSIRMPYLPVTQVNGMPVQNSREMTTGTLNENEPTALMVHFNELGRVGTSIKWEVWIQYQLQVLDRYAHGVQTISTT